MPDFSIRLFASEAAVRRIGEGLLACTLPRHDWTHEAHLAACLWLLDERAEIALEQDLPGIIRTYNESVGGVNDDTQGYHETLTQLYIRGVRMFAEDCGELGIVRRVNALLATPIGARDWPLRFYSRERLFSIAARRGWMEPDLSQIA
jgi:hypothetical protein